MHKQAPQLLRQRKQLPAKALKTSQAEDSKKPNTPEMWKTPRTSSASLCSQNQESTKK
jgi:hypothetical protein